MTTEDHHSFRDRPMRPQDLGTLRTVMAADRTLMAWVRTSLSMLSFSFTIYKFLEGMANIKEHPESPQRIGLFLAGAGTLAMVLGLFSYWATLKDLQRTEEFRLGRPSLLMGVIMAIAGVALFVGIAKRIV